MLDLGIAGFMGSRSTAQSLFGSESHRFSFRGIQRIYKVIKTEDPFTGVLMSGPGFDGLGFMVYMRPKFQLVHGLQKLVHNPLTVPVTIPKGPSIQ